MARVKLTGLVEIEQEFAKRGKVDSGVIARMLEAGGDVMVEGLKASIGAHGLVRTGRLQASIQAVNMRISSDSGSIEVYPQGNQPNGRKSTPNATVGFVQDRGRSYGKHFRAGVGFIAEAENAKSGEVQETMARIWRESEQG